MILPDLNLILYAYNRESAFHQSAKDWWETSLSSPRPVGLCWAVMLGFIRISTQRGIFREPLPVSSACGEVRAWLAQPQVVILEPGRRHASILLDFLENLGAAGIAIEHQCELFSTDGDFTRFPGLRWTNPLTIG